MQHLTTHHRELFHVGHVVLSVYHTIDSITTDTIRNPSEEKFFVTVTEWGRVNSKVRKMVAIALFEEHYVALPCYTFKSKGFAGRPNQHELISLQDPRGTPRPQGDFKPLKLEGIRDDIPKFSELTGVAFTQPITKRYREPCLMEAKLDEESRERLRKLYSVSVLGKKKG